VTLTTPHFRGGLSFVG